MNALAAARLNNPFTSTPDTFIVLIPTKTDIYDTSTFHAGLNNRDIKNSILLTKQISPEDLLEISEITYRETDFNLLFVSADDCEFKNENMLNKKTLIRPF